jgi:cyclase
VYGRESSGVDAVEWAKRAVDLGAGELVVTSIDREGTGKGFDIGLTRMIAESVPVPVIAGGGAGDAADILSVIKEGKADAVSIASVLHYNYFRKLSYGKKEFSDEGNTEFLKRGSDRSGIEGLTIGGIKDYLASNAAGCRI